MSDVLAVIGGLALACALLCVGWWLAVLWRATRRERRTVTHNDFRDAWRFLPGGREVEYVGTVADGWTPLSPEQRRAAVAAATDCESCLPPGVADAIERGERVEFSLSDD